LGYNRRPADVISGGKIAVLAGICSPLSGQGGQAKLLIQRNPALSCSVRDSCGRRDRLQTGSHPPDEAESVGTDSEGELSRLSRETRQLIHT